MTYSVLPVLSVTVVPLDQHDAFGNLFTVLRSDETNDITQSRVGLLVTVSNTHTTTNTDIVTNDLVVFNDGNETNVVGEDVHSIVWRDSDGDLEFTREVVRTVERLAVRVERLNSVTRDLLLVKPDFVVGVGSRKKVLRDGLGELVDGSVGLGERRVDGTLDVTV